MRFRWCPPGSFMMGSPKTEPGRRDDEVRHQVTLTKGFWMGETEVTQKQWMSVMGENPSRFKGDGLPVEQVSWEDCQRFVTKVNRELGFGLRLPTEAEWEYACRAGTVTAYSWGNILNGDKANCDGRHPYGTDTEGRYLERTVPVESYAPNVWGLYDMHGNVLEWCSDWYGDYPAGSVTDPTGPASGDFRVLRGGGWHSYAGSCRSASRYWNLPGFRINHGFRLVCSAGPCG
ncbi:MAG: formylglycine-generating enzyme family protein [Kiritimatiellae bacterium]|nr:formylglycine-generating enzyme family protein [Kiritimatiellia bacterium]